MEKKGRGSYLPPKATSTRDLLHVTCMSIINLLYLLTKLLPKALEVGSSNNLLWLTSENTLSLPHAPLIYKREKGTVYKVGRKKKKSKTLQKNLPSVRQLLHFVVREKRCKHINL